MSQLDSNNPAVLLKRLCAHLSKNRDEPSLQYQLALKYIGSFTGVSLNEDEFYYVEKIKKKLTQNHQESDLATFSTLHQKLQTYNTLKNQWAILCLFLNLQNSGKQFKFKKLPLPITSTPFSNLQSKFETSRNTATSIGFPSLSSIKNEHITLPRAYQTTLSSGFGSSLADSNTNSNINKFNLNWAQARNKENVKKELSENTIIRELVYCLQGIEGNIFVIEDEKEGFYISPKVHVKKSLRTFALRMAELGWLFNKIKKFYDICNADKALGLVGQSFVAAINTELTEYYRYLAILEAQLQQEDDPNLSPRPNGLTLSRLQVWTLEPLCRLKMLSTLVDVCKGQKGGALASTVYLYLQHGDPLVKGLVENILFTMAAPICTMLLRWIFDGELEDTYHEFFVAADYTVSDEKLWREKYSLRKSMVPSFLSMNQAKKILSTGKSINFLRQLCQDTTPLVGRQKLMDTMEFTRLKSLFKQDHDSYLQTMIDLAYKETSLRVLDIMQTKYKFMDHLKAMRRYLLLGQGDFIRHLMDLLQNDLSKPAAALYLHNLSGILETAVRATNAQFDDPDILKRLDVRLLEVSPGDFGWDVFSLDYHVDGPIGTVFTPSAIMVYLRLFNALWRAKRMEYVLCGVWKSQMSHARLLKDIPELSPVLHQCHILASEMVHFIQQIQYYITFEVMECSWDVLEKKVKSAADLDQIIAAHEEFLDTILARSLLDEDSRILLNQLRTIYDLIIQLQNVHNRLCIQAVQEVDRIRSTRTSIKHKTEMGEWGIDEATVETNAQYYQELVKNVIPSTRAQLRILAQSYQDMVQKFLLMLTSHPDVSLQFLSFRLDFNEHYKNRNSRLRTHLTYQHRRLSSIGLH